MTKQPKVKSIDNIVLEIGEGGRIIIGDYVGPRYKSIGNIVVTDEGRVAYEAMKEEDKWVVNFGGKQGPVYDKILDLKKINGKLAYLAYKEAWYDVTYYYIHYGKLKLRVIDKPENWYRLGIFDGAPAKLKHLGRKFFKTFHKKVKRKK